MPKRKRETSRPTAGNVLQFPKENSKRTMTLPVGQAESIRKGTREVFTISNNSLERIGIFAGDDVIVKTRFGREDLKRPTVCLVDLPEGVCVKWVRIDRGGYVLSSVNSETVPDVFLPFETDTILGIIDQLFREPGPDGTFFRPYEIVPASRKA